MSELSYWEDYACDAELDVRGMWAYIRLREDVVSRRVNENMRSCVLSCIRTHIPNEAVIYMSRSIV